MNKWKLTDSMTNYDKLWQIHTKLQRRLGSRMLQVSGQTGDVHFLTQSGRYSWHQLCQLWLPETDALVHQIGPSLNHHEMSWDLFHARVREESQNLKPGQHGINLLMLRVLGPLLQRSWDVDGETGNQPHDHLSTEGMGIDGIHGIHGIWMLEQWSVFHPNFITHSKKHFQSSTLHIFLTFFDIVNIVLLTLIGLWIRCQ